MNLEKIKKFPIKIKNHMNSRGYGLYSTKDFEEGEHILKIKPLVAVLDEKHLTNGCSNCFLCEEDKDDVQLCLIPCKGCKTFQYCCQKCKEEDWKMFHQYECAFFSSKLPRLVPGFIRMCMRLIYYGRCHPSSLEWKAVMQMEMHRSEIMSSEKKDIIWMMSNGIQNFTNETNEMLVLDLLCKIMINSFSLLTSSYDTIGTAIDPIISQINHSCYPNAILVFDRDIVELRSLQKISIDQEITISYIDVNNIQKNRQDELFSRYYFLCKCVRCKKPEELENYIILKNNMSSNEFLHLETVINRGLNEKNKYILQALSMLHRLKGWDSVIYPINELHKLALVYFLDESNFYNALFHGLFIHLLGSHTYNQYISDFNPVYVTQKFLYARLMIFQASENDQKQFRKKDIKDLMKYAYKLLYELVKLSYKSHGLSSRFSKKLQKTFEETSEDIGVYDWGKYWQLLLKNDPENPLIKEECSRIENNLLLKVKKYIEELSKSYDST